MGRLNFYDSIPYDTIWSLIYKTSFDKVTTKVTANLRQNVRHLISCRTTASNTHAVII